MNRRKFIQLSALVTGATTLGLPTSADEPDWFELTPHARHNEIPGNRIAKYLGMRVAERPCFIHHSRGAVVAKTALLRLTRPPDTTRLDLKAFAKELKKHIKPTMRGPREYCHSIQIWFQDWPKFDSEQHNLRPTNLPAFYTVAFRGV